MVAAPAPIFSFGNTSDRDHGRSFPSQEKIIRHARTEDAHADAGCRAPLRDRTREDTAILGNPVAIRDRTREDTAILGNPVAIRDPTSEGTATLGNRVALRRFDLGSRELRKSQLTGSVNDPGVPPNHYFHIPGIGGVPRLIGQL